jgi:hypothetical protein
MIISFSGRKSSGKTMLAEEAIKRGFKKISFADKLKKITSKLINCEPEDLYDPIRKEEKFKQTISWLDVKPLLENILNKDINIKIENKVFENRREILQFLGTEVLRSIDPEFHVNSLKEQIKENENYVLDDTRFENELKLLNEYNATCIFVIRSNNLNYSNHKSETCLSRQFFERIFNNNSSKEKAKEVFNRFLDNKIDLKNSLSSRHGGKLSDFFLTNGKESARLAGLLYICGELIIKNNCNLLFLDKNTTNKSLSIEKPIDLFSISDGRLMIDNEIYIDDLKRWDILEKNKNPNHIPAILDNEKEIQKHWLEGVKEGLSFKSSS